MSLSSSYAASHIKRERATKEEVGLRRDALFAIVNSMKPMTIRQTFYQASVRGIVEKAETGYRKVQTDLVLMRKSNEMPYSWIVDNTRWQRKPRTFSSIQEALKHTAKFYRKSLWDKAGCYVEIWIEKDALAGVVMPVTSEYDVPLMVARGYSSLSYLAPVADYIRPLNVPCFFYHFGDYDPSGVDAARKVERTLRELAPNADVTFERIAVTPEQIVKWSLPTRATKQSDTRAKGFGPISADLDAIEPNQLRMLVRDCIERHLSAADLAVMQTAEDSERAMLLMFVEQAVGGFGEAA